MDSCKNETFSCDNNDVEVMGRLIDLSKCKENSEGKPRIKRENIRPPPNNNHHRPNSPEGDSHNNEQFWDNQPPPEDVENEWSFVQEYMSLGEEIRKMIGHSFTSFIKSCLFRGVDCLNET